MYIWPINTVNDVFKLFLQRSRRIPHSKYLPQPLILTFYYLFLSISNYWLYLLLHDLVGLILLYQDPFVEQYV